MFVLTCDMAASRFVFCDFHFRVRKILIFINLSNLTLANNILREAYEHHCKRIKWLEVY